MANDYARKIIPCTLIRAITCHVNASVRESFSRVSRNSKTVHVKFARSTRDMFRTKTAILFNANAHYYAVQFRAIHYRIVKLTRI